MRKLTTPVGDVILDLNNINFYGIKYFHKSKIEYNLAGPLV